MKFSLRLFSFGFSPSSACILNPLQHYFNVDAPSRSYSSTSNTDFLRFVCHSHIHTEWKKKKERMTQEADVTCSPCDWLNVSEWMLWDAASGIHAAGVIHRWCSWLIYRLRYPFFACPLGSCILFYSGTQTTTDDDTRHDDDDDWRCMAWRRYTAWRWWWWGPSEGGTEGRTERPSDQAKERMREWASEGWMDGVKEWLSEALSDGLSEWFYDLMIWSSSILLNYKREGECKQSNYKIHAVATDFNCVASMHSVTTEFNCISTEYVLRTE